MMLHKNQRDNEREKLRNLLFLLIFMAFLYLGIGCGAKKSEYTTEINNTTMVLLDEDEMEEFSFADDLAFKGIDKGIQQSIAYFRSLPESRNFSFPGFNYSAKEMELSLLLFLELIERFDGARLDEQIKEKFLVFESKNTDGNAFFTGYYEPILHGSLEKTKRYRTPLYPVPDDLVIIDLGLFKKEWENKRLIGRMKGQRFIPYDSRKEIVYKSSLKERVIPLLFVENEIELFFLQIQGSGLVKLPDDTLLRVGYAGQNGHSYRAIGRLLLEDIPQEKMSMQAIKKYLYRHPKKVKRILAYNPSYIFFRPLEEGPIGVIQTPLTPERSIAMDDDITPMGGLAYIQTTYPTMVNEPQTDHPRPLNRFILVQDTGGAIKGHGRGDIFFGHEKGAASIAGHMKEPGRIFLLVAKKEYINEAMTRIRLTKKQAVLP